MIGVGVLAMLSVTPEQPTGHARRPVPQDVDLVIARLVAPDLGPGPGRGRALGGRRRPGLGGPDRIRPGAPRSGRRSPSAGTYPRMAIA